VSDIERIPSEAAAGSQSRNKPPGTVPELLQLIDAGWTAFRAAVMRFPGERMDERIEEHTWTRKQMLAHVATWHDLTHSRLGRLMAAGKPAELRDETDAINAQAARQAVGKTAGEIVTDMEASFDKLRRQVARLSDEQLASGDGWAAQIIADNTYDHYDEHMADLETPAAAAAAPNRRRA